MDICYDWKMCGVYCYVDNELVVDKVLLNKYLY